MGVRTFHEITFRVGRENSLLSGDLIGDMNLNVQLDTLARAKSCTLDLAPGESNVVVDFGDVAVARIIYIEADREIQVTPGAPGLATAAIVTGVAGSFPTGFTGGLPETLTLDVDNFGPIVTSFSADASLAQDVVNAINAAFGLAGFLSGGEPKIIASLFGGELRFTSPTTGELSEVEVVEGTAGVLATLGLTAAVTNGVNALSGQTPFQLFRPANTSNPSLSDGVKSFALMSLRTTSLLIDNLDSANPAKVDVVIAGDVLTTPPADC